MEKKNRNKDKNKIFSGKNLIVWFFIITMTFSIGGFLFSGDDTSQSANYNGYNLYRQNNLWNTKINGKIYPFTYTPNELEAITIDGDVKNMILEKNNIILTFNPDVSDLRNIDLARFETTEDFEKFFAIYVTEGITNKSKNYNFPILTCENATDSEPVIFMNPIELTIEDLQSENTSQLQNPKIYIKGNCIVMEGESSTFVEMRDRIIYSMIGVMK